MTFREKLKSKQVIIGTWCLIPSPEVINIIAKTGIDFVLLDMEHGSTDNVTLQRMAMSASAEGAAPVVRVGSNNEIEILRALDTGVVGIIVPHIESVDDCQKALSYIKYPPVGIRGFSPYTRAGGYSGKDKKLTESINKNIATGIIIEGENGIAQLADIIDNDELDLVYIGTYDISSMLGIPGQTTHPKVIDVMRGCIEIILNAGKIPGCMFHNESELKYLIDLGVSFLVYKVDSSVIFDGFSEIVSKVRGE